MFLRVCPFLLGCPFCWHIVAPNSLLQFFCFSVVLVVTSAFSFLILLNWVLSFFFLLRTLAEGLSVVFILSKKQAFSFLDLLNHVFGLCFIYFFLWHRWPWSKSPRVSVEPCWWAGKPLGPGTNRLDGSLQNDTC